MSVAARRRRPLFCGNWKLYGGVAESLALASAVRNGVAGGAAMREAEVVLAPGFLSMAAVARRLEGGPVSIAGQDCFWEAEGAYTGEVAAGQLKDAGCKFVIVGHSERRQHFGELDAAVSLKARAALRAGLAPILCVGETAAERDAGETLGRIRAQVDSATADIGADQIRACLVAYEPVWAIGTGRNATPAQAEEVHRFIRSRLAERFAEAADEVRILYGGSVKPDNIRALASEEDVDGALVGGASLNADSFIAIVKEGTAAWSRRS